MEAPYDLVSHVVRFCRSLRERGLLVGPSETADAARGLALVNPLDQDQIYWCLRAILVSRVDEIEAFDDCFHQFWTFRQLRDVSPVLPRPALTGGGQNLGQGVEMGPDGGQDEGRQQPVVQIVGTGASWLEAVSRRDLTVLKENELAEVSEIAARVARALPSRPGRRRRRHRRKGVPDLRGAFRLNLAHAGDPIILPRRRRVPRVPRLLVVLDVSGSMERHAKLLLQLVYALGQRAGRVETFVFSTSLTRVTRHLRAPSFPEALRRIGDAVSHWSGGTRIGECLGALNRQHSHLLDSSTSVFLLSDGWETGDPDHLAQELSRLRRQVRRLVWLNPLLGTQDYAPLSLGLQAARPHVDSFASAKDLAQLKRLPHFLRG